MKLPTLPSLFRKIGVDLGTTRTRIWHDQLGVLVDEATCLAVDTRVKKVVAAGNEAAAMLGRVPEHLRVIRPLERGVVADPEMAKIFLRLILQKVIPHTYFFRPVMMASVAAAADEVDRQALMEVLYGVGAREVYLISQPLAAAIGADIPIADASGSFLLHLGGGIVEGGIISFGSLVASRSSPTAGLVVDERIAQSIYLKKSLVISVEVAEKIKQQVASVTDRTAELLITGQDVADSAPKEVKIETQLVHDELTATAGEYSELMKMLLEQIAPELTADVIDKGMLLTGGVARLHGLDSFLVKKLGISVSVVEDADQAVIKGIATALQYLDLFKESLGYTA